ncbi:MAG TPA: hypothetical protein PLJ48_08135, partial [Dermatophilaceae bacterium]|nr:hypothetical protein [Dermatophilaceae bacterium]
HICRRGPDILSQVDLRAPRLLLGALNHNKRPVCRAARARGIPAVGGGAGWWLAAPVGQPAPRIRRSGSMAK